MLHLHAQAIVHRDLKPANLLLRYEDTHPTWRLRIADFGSSREVPPAACRTQSVLPSLAKGGLQRLAFPLTPRTGTITHRAPETFLADAQYGCPADAWSCGSIIYQFINGYRPSRQHREADVLFKTFADKPARKVCSGTTVVVAVGRLLGAADC